MPIHLANGKTSWRITKLSLQDTNGWGGFNMWINGIFKLLTIIWNNQLLLNRILSGFLQSKDMSLQCIHSHSHLIKKNTHTHTHKIVNKSIHTSHSFDALYFYYKERKRKEKYISITKIVLHDKLILIY